MENAEIDRLCLTHLSCFQNHAGSKWYTDQHPVLSAKEAVAMCDTVKLIA